MRRSPLVSVVMPAYNASKTIASAVMSILTQTYEKWELIVVDDGSDDRKETERILARFSDLRIKFIRAPHGDVVRARMTGYNAAKGELMAVQDADDCSLPDRLQRAVEWFEKHPHTDVYCASLYTTLWDPTLNAIIRSYRASVVQKKETLLRAQSIMGHPVFRRKVIKKCPLREETRHAYDWMMHLDWMYSGFVYGFDSYASYEYVRRQNSLSERNEKNGKRHESLLKMQEILKKKYGVEFCPDDWKV